MSDALRRKLEQRMDRRSFLRGSGLAAAAFVGGAAFPLSAQSQDPQKSPAPTEKPEAKEEAKEEAPEEASDAKKDADAVEPDPFKVTKKDAQGRDYRMCPQCGYNMYKQDRTWTCENCGYSYVE
jgi:hypothetical protein